MTGYLFPECTSREYYVKNVSFDNENELNRMCWFILWIIFMIIRLTFWRSMSDIVYKKYNILVHTTTFNIIVSNQQK